MLKNYHFKSIISGNIPLHILSVFLLFSLYANAQINFAQSTLKFDSGKLDSGVTSLMFGPDGRLYLAEYTGAVKILTVERTGATEYTVIDTEVLNGILTMADYNDDGGFHYSEYRETTGLTVGGSAANPVIYVASSDFRIGAGGGGGNGDVGLDTNSGVITRFSWNGNSWDEVDLVRGLPRSEENHATNGLEITTIKGVDYLIVAQGGHTNGGGPSINFVYTCEYALSGAILSINLDMLNNMPVLNDEDRAYIYDIPTLDDPSRPNVNGIIDPNSPGYDGIDVNDPFGGNDGLNMAIVDAAGPVQILSPGYRNAYDLVVTETGALYVTDNGANGGWGGFPANEGGGNATNAYVSGEPGSSSFSGGEKVDNKDHLQLVTTDLQNYTFGSYYGGHPNPVRANPIGAGLYTDNASAIQNNGTAVFRTQLYDPDGSTLGSTTNPDIGLPANWPPVSIATPVEGDWRGPSINNPDGPNDDPVLIWGTNTNGIDEYTASNFGGAMRGNLLAGTNGGVIRRVELDANGGSETYTANFLSGIGGNALGITANSDTDIFPGTIWAGTLNGKIVVFEPQDFILCVQPGSPGYNPLADNDADGYTNKDEIDNGTDPCNGGSQPVDFDKEQGGFLVSDLNDTDDDFDGILDALDPFQLGNSKQAGSDAFTLPIRNDLFNDQQGLGGIFGLGMTGLMNNGDTTANWLNWIDRRDDAADPNPNDVLGGAPGIMTSHMTSGTALGLSNNQEKAYQYGVQTNSNSGIFTVIGGMNGFTGPLRLYGNTAATGGELGFFIGDGTQSNYIKFVVTVAGFTIMQEINDVPQSPINIPIANADRPNGGMLFYFVVDPTSAEVQMEYQIDGGVRNLAGVVVAQGTILNAIQNEDSDLAVGFIGTSGVAGVELEGSWDFMNVISEKPFLVQEIPDIKRLIGSTDENIDLASYFDDDLGDANLSYTLITNTDPTIGALINGDILTLSYPSNTAKTTIKIRATDEDNLFVEETFTVDVYGVLYSINAGGDDVTYNGEVFSADSNFSGGKPYSNANATVSQLYKTERFSPTKTFTYDFPVPNGDYEVSLYMAEIYWGATGGSVGGVGKRIFDVDAEGQKLLDDYDIYADMGAQTEVVKTFTVSVTDGELNLLFDADGSDGVNAPKISAIKISSATTFLPITVNPIAAQSNKEGDEMSSLSVVVSGGNPAVNFTYSISGQPEGIYIEPTNGLIYGTVAANTSTGGVNSDGVHNVVVTVSKPGATTIATDFTWSISLSSDVQMLIAPNPADYVVYVYFGTSSPLEIITLNIYDSNGTLVKVFSDPASVFVEDDNYELYISDLPIGTYTVEGVSTVGNYRKELLIQRGAIAVTGISLNVTDTSVEIGQELSLTATVAPSTATDTNVTWASSDESIATIDASGRVFGLSEGQTTITVTSVDGSYTATTSLNVVNAAVSDVEMLMAPTPADFEVYVYFGSSIPLEIITLNIYDANGTLVKVFSNPASFFVADDNYRLPISDLPVGAYTVEGVSTIGSFEKQLTIQRGMVAVTGISLNESDLSLAVGDTFWLRAAVQPVNATEGSLVWSSSDTTIATVSEIGVVTGLSDGEVIITATSSNGEVTATANVTISGVIMLVAPNPATFIFYVYFYSPNPMLVTRIVIYDLLGRQLKVFNDPASLLEEGENYRLMIDDLPSGNYIIQGETTLGTFQKQAVKK